jgi:hypothetical protein
MEYPLWRTEEARRRGRERRAAESRSKDEFIGRVMAHVREVGYHGSWVTKTATRRRNAMVFLTAVRNGEVGRALADRFGISVRQADKGLQVGPALVLEVIRSGKLGVIEGWGLEVAAECERRCKADVSNNQRDV